MSVASGVFTKYALEFPGLSLKISNDRMSGSLLLDADVDVKMAFGTQGSTFTIVIYELPADQLQALKDATTADAPIAKKRVKIQLGYFETSTQDVLEGVMSDVSAAPAAAPRDGLLAVTIKGTEAALFACNEIKFPKTIASADAPTYAAVAQKLVDEIFTDCSKSKHAGIDSLIQQKVTSDAKDSLTGSVSFLKGSTVLTALQQVATRAKQELLIIKGVFLGSPIVLPDWPELQLDPQVNLAAFEQLSKTIKPRQTPAAAAPSNTPAPKPKGTPGFNFTAVGDPTLRPGQKVSVTGVVGTLPAGVTFVIRSVEHKFDSTKGYSCICVAAKKQDDGSLGPAIDAAFKPSAATAAQDLTSQIKGSGATSPSIEVVQVFQNGKDHYRADLFHGAVNESDPELQPSIKTALQEDGDQIYEDMPIASPFAWRKCGLVTPYYRGMKAVVAHNAGLANDCIVTGYIWSEKPDSPPPSSADGDWWLCLPIDLQDAKPTDKPKPTDPCAPAPPAQEATYKSPPDDSTKAVNDLTSAAGLRVIEAKGLRITIGTSKLGTVGARPTDAAKDEFLIEHASGTTLHIDSQGALTIDASNASVSIKGSVVIEGTLEIK